MDANHSVASSGEESINNYDFYSFFTDFNVQLLNSPNPGQVYVIDPGLLVENVEKETVLERHQDNSLTSNATQDQGHHCQTLGSLYGSGSGTLPVPVDVQEHKKPGIFVQKTSTPYGRTPTPEKNVFKVSDEVGRNIPAVSQAAPLPYHGTPLPDHGTPLPDHGTPLPDHGTPHVGRSSSTVLVNQQTKTDRTISPDRKQERMWQKPDDCADPKEKKRRANARKARLVREKKKKEDEELKGQVQLANEELKKMQKTMEENSLKHTLQLDEERQTHGMELDELKTELTKEKAENRILIEFLSQLFNSGQITCVTGPGNEPAVVQIVQNP